MIDVKELRIGNHVANKKGQRVKVVQLPGEMNAQMLCLCESENDGVVGYDSDFAPIPLTAELLQELGFEKREGSLIWGRTFDKNCYVSFSPFEDDCWSLSVTPKDYRKRIVVFVSNLHEAENIVWFTLHKELIEE